MPFPESQRESTTPCITELSRVSSLPIETVSYITPGTVVSAVEEKEALKLENFDIEDFRIELGINRHIDEYKSKNITYYLLAKPLL